MSVWEFHSPEFEARLQETLQRRVAQDAVLDDLMTPEVAARLTRLAQDHGSVMQPGTIEALVRTGMDGDEAAVSYFAAIEGERELKESDWYTNLGRQVWSGVKTAGRVLQTPFKSEPDGPVQGMVSAPWRHATAGFRTESAKSAIRVGLTAADMAFEELVSRPLRTVQGGVIEAGINPTWRGMTTVNPLDPIGDLSRQRVNDPGKLAEAQKKGMGHVADIYRRSGRSAGLVAAQEGLDLGEGYLPGGRAGAVSRAEREGVAALPQLQDQFADDPEFAQRLSGAASQTLTHKGRPLSTGRFVAGEIFTPDTIGYSLASGLIDASVAWIADPAAIGLGKVSSARNLRRKFGVVDGNRKGIDRDKFVDEFLVKSKQGQGLVQRLTDADDWEDVYLALGSNKAVPREVVSDLVDASTIDETQEILFDALGYKITERPPTRRIHNGLKKLDENGLLDRRPFRTLRNLEDMRILNDMPMNHVNVENLDESIPHLRNYMINAQMPTDLRKKHMDAFGRIPNHRPMQVRSQLSKMYKDIDKQLNAEFGRNLNLAKRFNSKLNDYLTEARLYDIDALGNTRRVPGGRRHMVDGEWVEDPQATILSEYSMRALPLLDIREVRRAANRLAPLYDVPGYDKLVNLIDAGMGGWKTAKLARFGWPIRVTLIDEQTRMATVGLDSLYSHPLSWVAYVTGQKGDLLKDVDNLSLGKVLEDSIEFQKAMSRPGNKSAQFWKGGRANQNEVYTGDFVRFGKTTSNQRHFLEAASFRLRQYATDDIAKRVAGGLTPNDLRSINALPAVTETGKKAPWRMGRDEFLAEYKGLRTLTRRGEKRVEETFGPAPDDLLAQLRETGDWEAFSRARGYTDVEIEQFRRWMELNGAGSGLPLDFTSTNPDFVFDMLKDAAARSRQADFDPKSMDAVKEWFWRGSGARFRQELAEGRGASDSSRFLATDDAELYGFDTYEEALLNSRQFADHILEEVYYEGIQIITGNNPDLLNLIATSRLGGHNINMVRDSKFFATLAKYMDSFPDQVKGARYIDRSQIPMGGMQRLGEQLDKATEAVFYMLGSVPTDKLSRSPAFHQFFWKRVEANAIYMTPNMRVKWAEEARRAKMGDVAHRIELVGTNKGPKESIHRPLSNYEDIEDLAKAVALDETRRLLYSLDKRSQVMDIARNIFPFGEAFKEIFQTWFRLVRQNLQAPRRTQQIFDGAKDSGFFYQDEDTNEWMFGYRGGGMAAKILGLGDGESLTMEGRVRDLNLFSTTVIPGVGPVIAWPAARFVPDHPDWDWLNNALFPFGRPEALTIGQFIDEMAPPWAREFLTAFGKEEIDEVGWNNNVKDIATALIMSGQYERTEIDEALNAASKRGGFLYLIRSMVKTIAPSSVTFKFDHRDKNGHWFTTQVLSRHYSEMLDEAGGDSEMAIQQFDQTYGLDPLLLAQPRTSTLKHRAFEKTGADWERRNQDLAVRYDLTIGLFAPVAVDDDFDFDAYRAALGVTSEQLTAREQLYMQNHIRGSLQYRKGRDVLIEAAGGKLTDEVAEVLKGLRLMLREENPGFDRVHETIPEGARTEDMIDELYAVVADADPRMVETDAYKGLSKYLQGRDEAMKIVNQRGFSTLGGAQVEDLRQFLTGYGEVIVSEHPEFASMWRRVLSREVAE